MDDLFQLIGDRAALARALEDRLRRTLSETGHAGVALEVIQLAEQLAERRDAERRADPELAIARDVQSRLFPQRLPQLPHLDIAARCIQARSVGGDYYDFLDLAPGQIGWVLADVSGKGMHAALRMANMQAHVRSQAASAPQDPLRMLRQVNRMLCESTQVGHFATLFLGVWTDASRRLAYINCGHNPPLCLRRDGSVEWLRATATVLGAFEEWECTLGRLLLAPGDLVVAYSDGVTEAVGDRGHFGEERLVDVVRSHADAEPDDVVTAILERVQDFGAGERSDDLTLLVTRAR